MTTLPRLHIVTDDAVLADRSFFSIAEAVLGVCGPLAALHVRGPSTSGARLHDIARRLRVCTVRTGALLFLNDRIDIAMSVRADGVQLGRRSVCVRDARALLGRDTFIGASTHSAPESANAAQDGADFAVLGTIFESASHAGRAGAGTSLIRAAVSRTAVPVIAIGGLTADRLGAAAEAGAYGVAVLGGIWHAADPHAAAIAFIDRLQAAWPIAEQRNRRLEARTRSE